MMCLIFVRPIEDSDVPISQQKNQIFDALKHTAQAFTQCLQFKSPQFELDDLETQPLILNKDIQKKCAYSTFLKKNKEKNMLENMLKREDTISFENNRLEKEPPIQTVKFFAEHYTTVSENEQPLVHIRSRRRQD